VAAGRRPLEGVGLTVDLSALGGRRVLVTGHTGFKGSWLCLWLHRLGAQVTGYALAPPTDPSNYAASTVGDLLAGEAIADLRDRARLAQALDEADPEVIFHLGAQPIVRESYETPYETFEVNVQGTAGLLEAARRRGRPCAVVVVTSDKCYENRGQVWGYREDDPMGGYDPYSASKGAAELVTSSYRRSFFHPARLGEHGVQLASARAGNVIGGGDWAANRIVTDLVRAAREGGPVELRNPGAIRPWQHVLEPLSGYLTLAARMLTSRDPALATGWNFGPLPGDEAPVRDLADRFFAAWGSGSWRDVSDPAQPHEAQVLRLSIDKAVAELGWRPRWRSPEAIRRAALWYKAHLATPDAMRAACLEEIDAYAAAEPAV